MTAKRVLVTRSAREASVIARFLRKEDFEPVLFPLISYCWHINAVAEAASKHPHPDLLILTSKTTADVLHAAAPSAWKDTNIFAIGPHTAEHAQSLGFQVKTVPPRASTEDLIAIVGDIKDSTVIYPRSNIARPHLVKELTRLGANAVDLICYDNKMPSETTPSLSDLLPVDATTLLSGSAAIRLKAVLGSRPIDELGKVVVIGPTTAKITKKAGLPVHEQATPHSIRGVISALHSVLGTETGPPLNS